MADEHDPNDPRWDWLYGGGAQEGGRDESAKDQGGLRDPDHTAMLPQSPRPETPPLPSGTGETPPTPVTSFGGTYPRGTPQPPTAASPPAGGPAGGPAAAAGLGGAAGATGRAGAGQGQSSATQAFPRPTAAASPSGPRYAEPTPPRGGTGQPGGAAAPPRSPRRRRVRWLRIVVGLVVAWLLFLVVVPIYAWSKVAKVDAEPSGNRPAGGPGTTYLLVGSDSRAGLTPGQKHNLGTGSAAGQRTDTIILLHVSDGSGPNVMLSIPRDSYVEVAGHGMQKINSAYAYGGPKLLVQTVEHATGVRVDDYVEIGFTGVVDVVDAVGGITVCPKTSIHDPKAGNLKMQRGCQSVNGHVALDYSRSRAFPLGDITRTQHQREVIAATGSAAASWKTVAFPWRYWKVNMAGADSVRVGSNVGPFGFARFAWAMAHSSGPDTLRCVVPFSSLGTSTSVGSVVTWDRPKANAIFSAIENDTTSSITCAAQ